MNIYSNRLQVLLLCTIASSLAFSSVAAGSPQTQVPAQEASVPAFRDVRLAEGGVLKLTVVSPAGQKLANQPVTVLYNNRPVCQSKSGPLGQVQIKNLRPGLHTIHVGNTVLACRLWTAQSAPPNSVSNPAFVLADTRVRGQYTPIAGAPMMPMMAPAVLATGVTATALAVVLIGKSSGSSDDVLYPASP